MTPEEKAKELLDKYRPHVYCYLGSGMLTNDYDEGVAMGNAKACAAICVQEIIDSHLDVKWMIDSQTNNIDYWNEVLDYFKD